ncbi:MAG: SufB/SufD family protein, partial [Chthoniobacterales bacterium]
MITQTQTFNSNCGEAAWLSERKENALKRFLSLKQPTRRDEAWRFANLKETDLSSFVAAPPVAHEATIIARSHGLSEFSAKLIFANNRLLHCEKNNLPEGVIFTSLEEAERDHRELFEKYFMKNLARLGSEKFRALHEAQVQAGAFLYVPAGVVLEKPIELWHWVEGEKAAVFPHTLLVCAEGSCASVIDRFCSVKEEPSLACGVNDLKVEADARLHYVAVQEWSRQTTAFHINSTEVSQNATSTALQLNLGGRFVRAENDSRLLGEGARSVMLSINQAGADQEIDQRTLQDHIAPRATSDLLYHNALDDNARTIFAGLIKV